MPRLRVNALLLVGSLLFVSVPAHAQDEPAKAQRFGDAGQFALSLNEGFGVNTDDILQGTQLQANVFVAPHVSVGLMIGAQWFSSPPITNTTASPSSASEVVFRIGPRIGYDIPVSAYVSIWPQIGVDYRSFSETSSSGSGPSASSFSDTTSAFAFTAVVPVLIHPTKGFFIGAGPFVYSEFSDGTNGSSSLGTEQGSSTYVGNNKLTSVGLMATIGGAI
jgi:Outer membrane protein beta-barrel domain